MIRIRSLLILSTLFLAVVISHGAYAAETKSVADFPTFGLQFAPPAGAVSQLPGAGGQIAFYHLQGSGAGAAILVEIVPGKDKSAEDAAKAMAAASKAPVTPGEFPVGAEKAFTFSTPMKIQPFIGRQTYVVVHDGWVYVFSGLSTATASADGPMRAMLQSVKFAPPESPLKHLADFSDKPLKLFGRFSIDLPAMARPTDADAKLVHLGIYDYTVKGRLGNPVNIDIEHIKLAAPKTFADIRDAYSAGLQKQFNAADKFVWQTQKDVPGLNVSQAMKMTMKAPDGTQGTLTNRFCLLELASGDMVQILFTFSDLPAQDLAAYNDLSDRILASIKLLPPPAAGK